MARSPLRAPAALWLLALGACGDGAEDVARRSVPADAPRLVVLYATCTLDKRCLAPYDETVGFTPNLARLAEEGVTFARHRTEAGQSGTAFASIFSGTQADRHGVYDHPTWLGDDAYLIGEAFAERGYETYFWSGHKAASGRLNYGQGIPAENVHYGDFRDREALAANEPRMDRLLAGLARDPERRAFVQINFTVTHGPYDHVAGTEAVQAFLARHPEQDSGLSIADFERALALYDANRLELQWDFPATVARLGLSADNVDRLARALELVYRTSVAELDRLFGRLYDRIRATGLLDDALIAFTADHGELLYRENALFKWTHGAELVPEVLDVPLIVRDRRTAARPGRYDAVSRSIDVFPTLMGLAGMPLEPGRVDGVDLSAALRGEAPPPRLRAFSHTCTVNAAAQEQVEGWSLLRSVSPGDDPELLWVSVRDEDRHAKLVRLAGEWRVEVYDLASDPTETRDLFDAQDPEHVALRADLEAYKLRLVEAHAARPVEEAPQRALDGRRERILRDLGYIK